MGYVCRVPFILQHEILLIIPVILDAVLAALVGLAGAYSSAMNLMPEDRTLLT